MRVTLIAAGLLLLPVGAAAADEACRAQVEAAFNKQAAVPKLRSVIVSPIQGGMSGMIERTVDLVRPDKVYSRVKSTAEEGLAETIVVGQHAWSNSGMGWDEIKPNIAKVMSLDIIEMNKPQKVAADFSCAGKATIDGKEYTAFRGAPGKGEDGTELVTLIYVDPASGLPAYNIIQPSADEKATPLLKVAYAYSDEIAVEPPMAPTQGVTEQPAAEAPQPTSEKK